MKQQLDNIQPMIVGDLGDNAIKADGVTYIDCIPDGTQYTVADYPCITRNSV